ALRQAAAADPHAQADAKAALVRDSAELRRARDDVYLLGKLSEREALGGAAASKEADAVDALVRRYDAVLGPEGADPLYVEAGEQKSAEADAARRRLADILSGKAAPPPAASSDSPLAGTPVERDIQARLDRIEGLQARAQGQLAQRDAAGQLLSVADRVRNGALQDRRSGKDDMEFHKNFARLGMVMDLTYSLNVINAAEGAIAGMQALLDQKLAAIAQQRTLSQQAAQAAQQGAAQKAQWDQEVKDQVASDQSNVGLFTTLGEQAGRYVDRLTRYQNDVKALVSLIDARDRAASTSADAEYQRRLALLPSLVQWRTHGYPGSGSSLSQLSLDEL
ncbi:MAG: hypothetical protein KGL53_12375, partial [Elusimicrobia bacterium]|nr:hypothetical protein [Elusimicrobiota bacterium]